MSESASGGEVWFVRLYFAESNQWLATYRENGPHFQASFTDDEKKALVFVSPSAATLKTIGDRLGEVETREATFEDWVQSPDEKEGGKILRP